MLAPPSGVGAPPLGNPRSATECDKRLPSEHALIPSDHFYWTFVFINPQFLNVIKYFFANRLTLY